MSLVRPGRKQARKHIRDARDFNNIETRAVIKFFLSVQGKAPMEIHAILTETLACFLPGRAKDLSAPLHYIIHFNNIETRTVIKFLFLQVKAPKEIHSIFRKSVKIIQVSLKILERKWVLDIEIFIYDNTSLNSS